MIMKKLTMRRDRHLLIFIFALLFCISGLLLIFVFSTLLPERADEIQALGVSLFIGVTPRTSFSELQSSIENSKNLTIVQTWTPDLKGILDAAEPMVLGGGKVSIFLLHPESAFASQRSLDCGDT